MAHAPLVMDSINASLPQLQFIAWGQRQVDLAWARKFCENNLGFVSRGEALIYFAMQRGPGGFVGNFDLHHFDLDAGRCQIGYVANSRFAGRGLMREAALALMTMAFDIGFQRIEAWCDRRNERSIHFAQRLGMLQEGVLRSVERDAHGALCDQVVLAMLRSEFPAAPS
jgi:RimJ/RimL family protein N-acetyltransferase